MPKYSAVRVNVRVPFKYILSFVLILTRILNFNLRLGSFIVHQVDGSCNVNWTNYSPEADGPASSLLATAGRLLAYFVVLFPAMDVTSVYPLNVMVSLAVCAPAPQQVEL